MEDNIKYVEKQIEKNRIEAQAIRRQADVARNQAIQYNAEGQETDNSYYLVQAQGFEQKAEQLEAEASRLEPKKAQIEVRISELKTERETINRETVNRTLAIDKELARIQGNMTI